MQDFFPKITEKKLDNALYIVATPIGNLLDISLRALMVLKNVDFIVCEDTRVSIKLLNAYEITEKKLLTYNDHSDEKIRDKILNLLIEGKSIALISDAGTPLISDPGYKLINFLYQKERKVIAIPGASALISALSVSGVACDNFLFLGFLPTSLVQKEKLLKSLPKNFTFAFFEAPSRVMESLNLIEETLSGRKIAVVRELTKIHEEVVVNDAKNVINFFTINQEKLRGEFVVVVEKADKNEKNFTEEELIKDIMKSISLGHSLRDLSQNLAEIYGLNRKDVYNLALKVPRN